MEDLNFESFDIGGILSEEEANKLFEDAETQEVEEPEKPATETEKEPTEEEDKSQPSEKVGVENPDNQQDTIDPKDGGSSPNIYASIANALKVDGIFPDFTDDEIKAVDSAEAFAEMFEKAVSSRYDERQRRVEEMLNNGVAPNDINNYERTINYLDSITEEALSAESEEGENLRKQLIYNDFINKGFSHDKAVKEVDKSIRSESDLDDAKDALEALKTFYNNGYKKIQDDARAKTEEAKQAQKKQAEDFKKMLIDTDIKFGDVTIDKKTRQRAYDAVMRPVYKDPKTGVLMTEIQKMQKENPLEFMKQLGLWCALTNGGKDLSGIVKEQLRMEKNKGIKELERSINASSLNPDGTLKYASPVGENSDPLLSDKWKVGW